LRQEGSQAIALKNLQRSALDCETSVLFVKVSSGGEVHRLNLGLGEEVTPGAACQERIVFVTRTLEIVGLVVLIAGIVYSRARVRQTTL